MFSCLRGKRLVFLAVLCLSMLGLACLLAADTSSVGGGIATPGAAPLNPQFEEYLNRGGAVAGPHFTDEGHALGLIPSPIPPRKHIPPKPGKLRQGSGLPTSYDMRSLNFLTPAKDQGTCGCCWAFATYGSLESQDKQFFGLNLNFSENNLIHLSGFEWAPCYGGNIQMSSAYLARYAGPINETADPYNPDPNGSYCATCTPSRYIDNVDWLPVRANATDNDYIKQAVMDHGGIYTTLQWEDGSYDPTTYTYYHQEKQGVLGTNHAVVIVGWDDAKVVPAASTLGAGAFIARNSWGPGWGDPSEGGG